MAELDEFFEDFDEGDYNEGEDYPEISSHTSKDGWESHDYLKISGGENPSEFDNARLFKVILRGEDEAGNVRYLSTNIFSSLDEAEGNAEILEEGYRGVVSISSVIIRAYY